MATFTSRMGLTKPLGTEPRSVTPINLNSDTIDSFMPCILVADGVTPPTASLYDGALVKERTSGIIWEARKNGGGTFDKVYVRYPYVFYAFTTTNSYAISDTTFRNWGWGTYYAGADDSKNSSAADLNGSGFWVCPVKGLYHIKVRNVWATNAASSRGSRLMINGSADPNNAQQTLNGQSNGPTAIELTLDRVFVVGDIVSNQLWQNSGGALNLDANIVVTMVEPIQ